MVQEALRPAAAIVATDAGGTAAVVGDAALLVPPGDPARWPARSPTCSTDPGAAPPAERGRAARLGAADRGRRARPGPAVYDGCGWAAPAATPVIERLPTSRAATTPGGGP